jgi:hypothetical protein
MLARSFRFSLLALCAPLAFLAGCKTMPELKDVISLGAGAVGAVVCYKNVGGGSMRIVTGAACGVGVYLLAEWLQKGTAPSESTRVQGEYQKALTTAPQSNVGYVYNIDTRTSEGPVRIVLAIYPKQQIAGTNPMIECRWFNEKILSNGTVPRSEQNRQFCHNWTGQTWSDWAPAT